jgi:hypothetical protein
MTERDHAERLFPPAFLRRLDEAHDIQARLYHADSLLRDVNRVREWLREEQDDRETYRQLKASRAELVERLDRVERAREDRAKSAGTRSTLTAKVTRRQITDVTNTNIHIRYPAGCAPSEGAVPVPVALEGTSVTPGGSSSGAITTHPTTDPWEASEPHYVGVLRIDFRFPPFDLSYWLHNWRWVIPFPCVPCDGTLTYRVYIETGGLFGASALSASLSNWINVREIADVSAGIDFSSVPDYEVWPINRNWPFLPSFMFEEIWDGVTLEGSFAVKQGKAPVLAVIVGVIVGLAGGRFTIFNAGFHPWEMQLFPPGGFPEPWDLPHHAKVHYRYEPSGGVFSP